MTKGKLAPWSEKQLLALLLAQQAEVSLLCTWKRAEKYEVWQCGKVCLYYTNIVYPNTTERVNSGEVFEFEAHQSQVNNEKDEHVSIGFQSFQGKGFVY